MEGMRYVRKQQRAAALQRDAVVEMGPGQQRRFGISGRMLKPSVASVADVVSQVPRGAVLSTTALRQTLARRHGVQATCPFFTKLALQAIAADPNQRAPYWRVVRPDGSSIDYFPGGAVTQARRLNAEMRGAAKKRRAPSDPRTWPRKKE